MPVDDELSMSTSGFDLVLQTQFRNWFDTPRYTPDRLFLEKYAYHYIFHYGTFRRGYSDANKIYREKRDIEWIGYGLTALPDFVMFTKYSQHTPNYPVGIFHPRNKPHHPSVKPGYIFGDVYRVPVDKLIFTDEITLHGEHFTRVPFLINGFDNEGSKYTGKSYIAWIYLGKPKFWLSEPYIELTTKDGIKILSNDLLTMNQISPHGVYAHRRTRDKES